MTLPILNPTTTTPQPARTLAFLYPTELIEVVDCNHCGGDMVNDPDARCETCGLIIHPVCHNRYAGLVTCNGLCPDPVESANRIARWTREADELHQKALEYEAAGDPLAMFAWMGVKRIRNLIANDGQESHPSPPGAGEGQATG